MSIGPTHLARKCWSGLQRLREAPGCFILAKGVVPVRELAPDAATPDPLSPAYSMMVGDAAARRLGKPVARVLPPALTSHRRWLEWQRVLSARTHAAVERMILGGDRGGHP